MNWKNIDTAPDDGSEIIVGVRHNGAFIVANAKYKTGRIERRHHGQKDDQFDYDMRGWFIISAALVERIRPSHWLCRTNEPKD